MKYVFWTLWILFAGLLLYTMPLLALIIFGGLAVGLYYVYERHVLRTKTPWKYSIGTGLTLAATMLLFYVVIILWQSFHGLSPLICPDRYQNLFTREIISSECQVPHL